MSLLTLDSELDWSILSDKTPDQHHQNPYQCNHSESNIQTTDISSASTKQAFSRSNWIIWCTTKSPEQPKEQTHTTNMKLNTTQKQSMQQPLRAEKSNVHWGNDPSISHNVFCILVHNVNTISSTDHFLQWQGIAAAMKLYNIHAMCLQEMNKKWEDSLQDWVWQALCKTHPWVLLSTSSSIELSDSETHYQLGGTAVIITGSHTTQILTHGQDPIGMGWWSYVELLGKNQHKIVIVSAYQVGPQQATIRSNMIYNQQFNIMLCQGHTNPQPWHQNLINLVTQINKWTVAKRKYCYVLT